MRALCERLEVEGCVQAPTVSRSVSEVTCARAKNWTWSAQILKPILRDCERLRESANEVGGVRFLYGSLLQSSEKRAESEGCFVLIIFHVSLALSWFLRTLSDTELLYNNTPITMGLKQ